ncbi:DNA polymerase III subunit delta [Fibrobacter sp.]|uniref:DNA polymerase III subunit delta n=1 Tax=Fibrobacter sp. TaxID=35828 RepID=UPI00388E2AFC
MIVALIGKDQFSKDIRIEKFIADALGERKDDPLSKQILYATDTNIPSIAEAVMTACDSVSMFSPEQAVVVRKAEALKADDTKALAKWLGHGPQCKLLLDFETLAANTELYKALKKAGEIEKEYDEPKSYKMADWIASVIPSHFKKAIDKDACQYLAEALGTDTKLACEEVEKILLFQPDCKKIDLELVKTMVVSQRKIVAYEINDYFGMRDGKAYAKKLNEMFNNGVQAVQIVASLYYYAVDLMNFSALLAKGMTPKDAAAELGKNDFIFNVKGKAPECARRWGKPLLCRVIRRLADLDFEIKSGKCSTRISQELALAALVVR